MKKYVFSILIVSNLFGQSGLTVIGGLNMSNIIFNDDDITKEVDIYTRNGVNIGLEGRTANYIAGTSFVQRGTVVKWVYLDYNFDAYDVYNYFSLHILYPISIGTRFEGFGGIQTGFGLFGETYEEGAGNIDSEVLSTDFFGVEAGYLIGASFMLNEKFGIRASYYLGLTDVVKDYDVDENYKNSTISLLGLMKL